MQRSSHTQQPPPPLRQSQPYPPTEPPLHSHSPFPSAAPSTAHSHASRKDKSAERHTRPAHVDPTPPSAATYAAHHSTAAPPPPLPPSSASSPQPHSSGRRGSHSSSRVSKQYDAASRGTVFCLSSPMSFLSLPTHPKPSSPSLLQPFLVLQLALPPAVSPSTASSFSLHLTLLSTSALTYSLVLSPVVPSITLHPYGADLPLSLASDMWLNVCVPVRDLLWDVLQVEYGGVESVTLKGQCKVRRVFGMRHAADTGGEGEAAEEDEEDSEVARLRYTRRESVPVEHDFEPDVVHRTLLYSQHMHRSNRRSDGQVRRRRQPLDESREERVDEGRRRVPRASRATMPHTHSRTSATEAPPAHSPLQWEESIEPTDVSAAAAPVQRPAASKSITRNKRATQPLPTRSLAPQQPAEGEKRPSFHVPASYKMVPYTEPPITSSNAPRQPNSSPPVSRQLQRERRNERRRTAENKPHSPQKQHHAEAGHAMDASAGLVFHALVSRGAADTPLSSASSALPVRPPVPFAHTASDTRPRSPVHVRRPPTLIRTYTAPETIDVQHNVVGRERRDTRGEERREDEDELGQVGMERAGTVEVYRTSPVVREHERRVEHRQHRRTKERSRRREEIRGREEDAPPQQQPQSHSTGTSATRDRTRISAAAQPSFAFRPDLSSADSTPVSASATSSHTTSRRASLSSSSASTFALPVSSGSDLSSTTVSLSSTPFTSLPASPTVRSARPSLIAHAVTSHHSAPTSRRQSVQAGKERDSGHQRRDEGDGDELDRKDERKSQRRSSITSRPNPTPLPRVMEKESGRHVMSSPLTAATITHTFSPPFPPSTPSASSSISTALSVVSEESAAAYDSRPGMANLFSSPSASIGRWPSVTTGPSSPPPFSAIRSTLPPFSFISKLSDAANSTPVAASTATMPPPATSSASVPVLSATSPSTAFRPVSSVSHPVSPSPSVSVDWAQVTVSEDARKASRDKTVSASGSGSSERGQERVLEEIEEEEVMDDEQAEEEDEYMEAEAAVDDNESTREDSALLHEPASGDNMDTSLHSNRSHHSHSYAEPEATYSNSSPTAASLMAVSQHLRRLSMQASSYDKLRDADHSQLEPDGGDEDTKHDEESELSEQDVEAADIPHFIHQLPASSTDTSFGSASFAAPVRSTPLLSMPSTSLVPMSSTTPERVPHSTSPAPSTLALPPQPSLHSVSPPPSPTPLSTARVPTSPPSRPVSNHDLLVRYDPVLRAYFCPDNGCWYELKADVE